MFGILFVSQRLYDAAKDAEESYEEDLTLTLRRVQFFNVKGTEAEEDGALIYAPTFGQNISLNSSGVHIPLEIFEGCKYSESICVVEISVQAVVCLSLLVTFLVIFYLLMLTFHFLLWHIVAFYCCHLVPNLTQSNCAKIQ